MSRAILEKFVKEYRDYSDEDIKSLLARACTEDMQGKNHLICSYAFSRLNGHRPRMSLLRFKQVYGGHVLQQIPGDLANMLKLRAHKRDKNPRFIRYMAHQQRMSEAYRREKGLHNKRRRQVAGRGFNVKIGYRTPAVCRGFGSLGYKEALIRTCKDLDSVDGRNTVVRIAHVGLRSKLKLEHVARSKNLWVTNGFKWKNTR